MKLNIFRSKVQQERINPLNDSFGLDFASIPTALDLSKFLELHDFDETLILHPKQYLKQKTSSSLFEICSFSTSNPIYLQLFLVAQNLLKRYDLHLIEYSKSRMMVSNSFTEIGFIVEFLSEVNITRAIEAIFDVIDDLTQITCFVQKLDPLFEPIFELPHHSDMFRELIRSYGLPSPAELILRIRKQIRYVVDAIETDLLPLIADFEQSSIDLILTFSTRLLRSVFSSDLGHTHTFQIKLLQIFVNLIEQIEPFESGYVSQSLRIEVMEKLNTFLAEIVRGMKNGEENKSETLVKLLMPFDSALEFNLKLRNMETEDLALAHEKNDTVMELIIDLALSAGIWSHPDFFLNRLGKKVLEEFNLIFLELLRLDQVKQFLLNEILLSKLVYCEIRPSEQIRDYLRSIPSERFVEMPELWNFLQLLLD